MKIQNVQANSRQENSPDNGLFRRLVSAPLPQPYSTKLTYTFMPTSRNPSKMARLAALRIKTLALDVLDQSSIDAAVSKIPSLDILVNNARSMYSMSISDLSIPKAKELFGLNVWSYLAVIQAFLLLLLEFKGMIVN